MSKTLKAKAPAVLMAALFLFSAPTALAGERTEPAPRVAQAQPAPTAPAAEPTQPLPRIAQAQPALPPTGDGFATKDDIRWGWEQNQQMWTEIRAEIRAQRAENERRWTEIRAEIRALHIAVITGLVAIVVALLGLIAVFFPRKNAPARAPESPRPDANLPRAAQM